MIQCINFLNIIAAAYDIDAATRYCLRTSFKTMICNKGSTELVKVNEHDEILAHITTLGTYTNPAIPPHSITLNTIFLKVYYSISDRNLLDIII